MENVCVFPQDHPNLIWRLFSFWLVPTSDHVIIKGLKETTHGYKKELNKANDFTCKLQYNVSIFSNRRQSDFTKCSLMISQREIMISRLV